VRNIHTIISNSNNDNVVQAAAPKTARMEKARLENPGTTKYGKLSVT